MSQWPSASFKLRAPDRSPQTSAKRPDVQCFNDQGFLSRATTALSAKNVPTPTRSLLKARAEWDWNKYPKGVKLSDAQLSAVNLTHHTSARVIKGGAARSRPVQRIIFGTEYSSGLRA